MKKNIPTYFLLALAFMIIHHTAVPMKYNWNPSEGTTQVGFSLQNNSDYLIQFQIYNESAGMYHHHVLEILPNGEYGINLNTVVPTRLKIYYCPEEKPGTCNELDLPIASIAQASFPLDKTIYLSWDGKELLPQNEGVIRNATKAGYNLTNNIQKTDYRLTQAPSSNRLYPREQNRDPWDVFPAAQEYAKTLTVTEMYTDATLAKLVLGLGGTPSDGEINRAWASISAQWNPDDHPNEPNFARAVMKIINRSRDQLFNPVIKPLQ